MIFKTIQDSVDTTRTKLLLFNKDWNTYKRNWQNASTIKDKIGSIFTSSNSNINGISKDQLQTLKVWNNAVKQGYKEQGTFDRIIANSDDRTKAYFNSLNKCKGSIDGLRKACGNLTLSEKAATVATKALSVAGNMIAMWAISEVITKSASTLSDYVNSTEIAKEKAESLSSSLSESQSKYVEDSKKISELSSKYDTLSKGVNHLGQNISLSSTQYDEYKSIVQQLSDLMPNLTTRFNEQGEKIGFVNGKLKDTNEEYKKYQQNQAIKFLQEGDSEGKTYQDAIDNLNEQTSQERSPWKQEFIKLACSLYIRYREIRKGVPV